MSEYYYLSLLAKCYRKGEKRETRSGPVRSLFGEQIRYNLGNGFPLLTTKRVHWKSVAVELLWFLRGDANVKYLHDHGVTIWDEWADDRGELGPVYGAQWRRFGTGDCDTVFENGEFWPKGIDQITNVIDAIKTDPHSRRHIVTAWNPAEIDDMALPPCHMIFQFHVSNDGKLSCHLNQRSADIFLGVPFNIASYALLTHLVARECGLKVGDLVISFGDVHLYENHVSQAIEQISRDPRHFPSLTIDEGIGIFDITYDNLQIHGYDPHPAIKAEVSK